MKLKENGYQNFLVLDFEFTVNNQRVGRPRFFFQEIIEVGAVWLCAPNYEIELDYQAFVKPRFYSRLTDECKNITLIKQEDIDNGLPGRNAQSAKYTI
ncbi:exonuclease domain-containing protein [Desulfolucanica intricata]|uniref:exonuclease domain-containing protein n=1 Tax=Desulfolucanica intricata TaxID=1285191 RepID=UPI001A9A47DA|nr:exonuclease domain-containing protein [Desulfolucanica intricata]